MLTTTRSLHLLRMAASGVGVVAPPWGRRNFINRDVGCCGVGRVVCQSPACITTTMSSPMMSAEYTSSYFFTNRGRRQLLHHRRPLIRPRRRRGRQAEVASSFRSFGSLGSVGSEGEGSAHQIAALVLWLRAHGVDFTDRAQFCKVRHMGVGGVATRDFDEGDVIFSLPLYGLLSRVAPGAGAGMNLQSRESPLVMTTSLVTSHTGPLGALGRALSVAGLTTQYMSSPSPSSQHHHRPHHHHHQSHAPDHRHHHHHRPSHRLGGIQESDHEFPLNVSHASLLALGVLHQCALAAGPAPEKSHWRAYVELLPRETDALLEWNEDELAMLQGSRHAERARRRIALVDEVYGEVFPALTDIDPELFGGGGGTSGLGTGTAAGKKAASDDGDGDVKQQRRAERLRVMREKKREMRAATAARRFTSREAFRWAFATVLARAFELPDITTSGGFASEMGLCPGLDLFNHGSEAEKCTVDGSLTKYYDTTGARTGTGKGTSTAGAEAGTGATGGVDVSDAADDVTKASDRLLTRGMEKKKKKREEQEEEEEEEDASSGPPRVTLRAGVGGAEAGEQLFHDYADHASGGALLEFGFTHFIPQPPPPPPTTTTTPSDMRRSNIHHERKENGEDGGGVESFSGWSTKKGRDPRRDLHAVDVSLVSLMREASGDGCNARRLAVLAAQPWSLLDGGMNDGGMMARNADMSGVGAGVVGGNGSLCRGLVHEVSNVAYTWQDNGGRRRGVTCIPPAMIRTARVLTLTDGELDALDINNVASSSSSSSSATAISSETPSVTTTRYDARQPVSAEHERRTLLALAAVFRHELEQRYFGGGRSSSRYDNNNNGGLVVEPTTPAEDDVILAALSSQGDVVVRSTRGGGGGGGGDISVRSMKSGDDVCVNEAIPGWARDRPELLGCQVRRRRVASGEETTTTWSEKEEEGEEVEEEVEEEEEARAARWRRRARMAVEVRRGEKLLLEDVAADLERLAAAA